MANQIKFEILLESAQATQAAQSTVRAFDSIGNAAQRVNAPLRTQDSVTRSLDQSVKTTRASMQAFSQTMAVFGGTVAPEVTSTVALVTAQLSALKATATATGASLAVVATSLAAGLVSLYAVGQAVQEASAWFAAAQQEKQAVDSLNESLSARRDKYLELTKLAEAYGVTTRKELSLMMHAYNDASTDAARSKVLRNWGQWLNNVGFMPRSEAYQNTQENYQNTLSLFTARSQGDDAFKREQIYQEAARDIKESFKVAREAGRDFEPLREAILSYRDRRLKELDEDAAKKNETKAEPTMKLFNSQSTAFTDIEKMGGILSGLGRGFGHDYARLTADNTRRTNEHLGRIEQKLGKGGGETNE